MDAFFIHFTLLMGQYRHNLEFQPNWNIAINDFDAIKLNEDVLNHIEVMLGPQTTDADKYIVEKLLAEFPQHTLTESYFRGKIRSKF